MLCRSLLIQQNLHVPDELKPALAQKKTIQKTYTEEMKNNFNPQAYQLHNIYLQELRGKIDCSNMDSSDGSDSEPSEDNLEPNELIKKLPVIDKTMQIWLKSANKPEKINVSKYIAQQPCLQKRSVSPKKPIIAPTPPVVVGNRDSNG